MIDIVHLLYFKNQIYSTDCRNHGPINRNKWDNEIDPMILLTFDELFKTKFDPFWV